MVTMEYLETMFHVKQEPVMTMKRRDEEEKEEEVIVSTELRLWPDVDRVQPIHHHNFINRRDGNQGLVIRRDHSSSMVSTKLELYCDVWKIKKRLTRSDLGNLSRLLILKRWVQQHIFPFFCDGAIKQVESNEGLRVCVWDNDTDSSHEMVFKKWHSSEAYIFCLNWKRLFVKRRNLKVGDKIGLFWDLHHSRFEFCILHRIHS